MSVRLSARPLSSVRALKELGASGLGGIVLFVGRVRPDRTPTGTIRALAYESHRTLALEELQALETEARERYGVGRIVIWHRIGTVPVGEPSVMVGAASSHRRAAFDATSMLIERLKSDVPLWKSERVRPGRPPRRRPSRGPVQSAG
ncbi:Molybdopterin biosynthesis MoaE [mine drainage metagenome]|uniref:Molybdopterin biosynthesis MoaE n=1 Tax=mine drainage metagenome TaxID=410659 RepID=T0ZMZ0_9ZZZZ